MFVVVKIQDLVQIDAKDAEKPSIQAIEDNINAKYANKVLPKTGLCVCLLDVLRTTEGTIGYGTGSVNVNVEFRLIVFRPFKGEIIEGVIVASKPEGITVSLDFFDDVFIPLHLLFEGTKWCPSEGVFVWDTEWGTELYFDLQEVIRFRVEQEKWNDVAPHRLKPGEEEDDDEHKPAPYQIIGSMMQTGLGPLLWWNNKDQQEEQMVEE